MSVAFLITSPYQLYHYKWIATHLTDVTALIELRDREFGLSEEFVAEHLPGCEQRWVERGQLTGLDGRFDAIVCQTPILPLEFLEKTLIVAQQYSLAKERYQYGVWRAHAHLNLMYGEYSARLVQGFCHAVAVGNPLLDPYFHQEPRPRTPIGSGGRRSRLLYMPTYGQLSTLSSVLPALRKIDAQVTLKLHHAEDSTLPAKRPPDLDVVFSDADPSELFRTHDGVISDVSGAAYDALYAGLPVVLADTSYGGGDDLQRLSAADRDHTRLAEVAAIWNVKDDLRDALGAAEKRLASPGYERFLKETFVNAGTAGAACANEIQRLIAEGEPEHFGSRQVRTATRHYISMGRRRRNLVVDDETGDLSVKYEPRPIRARRLLDVRLAYQRVRTFLAGFDRLRHLVVGMRRRLRTWAEASPEDLPGPPLPASPADRREAIFTELQPLLVANGVTVARGSDETGAVIAVPVHARRGLIQALKKLTSSRADLQIRVGTDWRIVKSMPLQDLRGLDLFRAHWLELGSVREVGTYRVGVEGYLTVLLVEHDRQKNRYLALKQRSDQVDWTDLFQAARGRRPQVASTGRRARHAAEPVDVVYTWVDSADPAWRAAHARYSKDHDPTIPSANNEERYIDREELRYSLRALWMFAPFVRNIFIVTAGQRPWWLLDDPRVRVVSHQDIFPDQAMLPTFNSHAIEACLHRIPDLSEHFLYLNDDVFVGREVTASDFFTTSGLAKVRLSPSQYIYQGEPEPSAIPTDWAAYNSVSLLRRDFGLTFDRRVQHIPLVQRRSVLEEIEQRYPDEIQRTRAARFRSTGDVAVPSMFGQFYAVATGRAVEWPGARNEYVYLDTGRRDVFDRFDQILRVRPRFFCLNATRYDNIGLREQARHLRNFLTPAFPRPAPWEKADGDPER